MNWIDECSQADECASIGNCKNSSLLFADTLVLLSHTKSGLQRALNSFADARDTAGMKISMAKTEIFHLTWNPDQCVLQVNGATLKQIGKFKYFGVTFMSDGREDEELDTRIGKTPRTRWTNYIEDLWWNCLGLHPSKKMDVMEDREVWRFNLELLSPPTLTENRAMKKEEARKKLTNFPLQNYSLLRNTTWAYVSFCQIIFDKSRICQKLEKIGCPNFHH